MEQTVPNSIGKTELLKGIVFPSVGVAALGASSSLVTTLLQEKAREGLLRVRPIPKLEDGRIAEAQLQAILGKLESMGEHFYTKLPTDTGHFITRQGEKTVADLFRDRRTLLPIILGGLIPAAGAAYMGIKKLREHNKTAGDNNMSEQYKEAVYKSLVEDMEKSARHKEASVRDILIEKIAANMDIKYIERLNQTHEEEKHNDKLVDKLVRGGALAGAIGGGALGVRNVIKGGKNEVFRTVPGAALATLVGAGLGAGVGHHVGALAKPGESSKGSAAFTGTMANSGARIGASAGGIQAVLRAAKPTSPRDFIFDVLGSGAMGAVKGAVVGGGAGAAFDVLRRRHLKSQNSKSIPTEQDE